MDTHAPAQIEPRTEAPAQEPAERPLVWGDPARFAKTGCRKCFGAGSVAVRGAGQPPNLGTPGKFGLPRVPVARATVGGGSPWNEKPADRYRCACTDRGLDRAGLVLVNTTAGVVARKAA